MARLSDDTIVAAVESAPSRKAAAATLGYSKTGLAMAMQRLMAAGKLTALPPDARPKPLRTETVLKGMLQGVTLRKIAADTGYSVVAVDRVRAKLRAEGLIPAGRYRPDKNRFENARNPDQELADVLAATSQGDLAVKWGVTHQAVSLVYRRLVAEGRVPEGHFKRGRRKLADKRSEV